MGTFLIKILLIVIAAVAKAIVDTVHHHPRTMIFRGWFWTLWPHRYVVPFTNFPFDAWHVFNSVMIAAFIGAGTLPGFAWYIELPLFGSLFILTFNIFYNKIFKK